MINKEIVVITNKTVHTFKKAKLRLSKSLGLGSGDTLDSFILSDLELRSS